MYIPVSFGLISDAYEFVVNRSSKGTIRITFSIVNTFCNLKIWFNFSYLGICPAEQKCVNESQASSLANHMTVTGSKKRASRRAGGTAGPGGTVC